MSRATGFNRFARWLAEFQGGFPNGQVWTPPHRSGPFPYRKEQRWQRQSYRNRSDIGQPFTPTVERHVGGQLALHMPASAHSIAMCGVSTSK